MSHKDGYYIRDNPEKFPLLSKRIFTQAQNDIIINFVALRKELRNQIYGEGGDIGLYFEYLPSGISIGINDTEEIRLASLAKVPIVMAIFRKVELGDIKLSDKVVLSEKHIDKNFGDLWKREIGTTFTVEELIQHALVESDNTAAEMLSSLLSFKDISDVYDNLEIEVEPDSALGGVVVSPKSYSSIFRNLYLSSYLEEEDSQYILDTLTKTIFKDKITANIPKNIPVSHKIGVINREGSLGNVYTDCGIFYVPNRPYILCMFVKRPEEEARKWMSGISYMIYSYIMIVKGGVN